LRGKTNAVAQGVKKSTGEILFFTDADCAVPAEWVEKIVRHYPDGSVGIVAGFTSLSASNWFEGIQALDWLVLFSVAAATVRLRYPVTAVGNNLTVRRAAYEKVGGYENIPFSVTEDYALFHAVTSRPEYRARFPLESETVVTSKPCVNWGELYRQKKRWFTGGKGMDIKSLLVFTIPYCFNLCLIAGLFVGPLVLTLLCLAIKVIVDFLLASAAMTKLRRWSLSKYFLIFELYYTLYVLVFPLIVLFTKVVVWKGRRFSDNGKSPGA
jgi:cellulose synthase/poly-beta-1,6-N-acetylglucosamine synthase-like glycosyltransferase